MRYNNISALLFACAVIAIVIAGAGAEPVNEIAQGYTHVINPPAPGFFSSDRYWPAPFAFSFADGICGAVPRTWHWDFGDGTRSNELNPAYTYTINGDFTVSLTMTTRYGRVTKTTRITG